MRYLPQVAARVCKVQLLLCVGEDGLANRVFVARSGGRPGRILPGVFAAHGPGEENAQVVDIMLERYRLWPQETLPLSAQIKYD